MPGLADLDDTDKAIIRALQIDGRTPYSKLGPAVGLSQAAVRQRVQRLIDKGVMQVVAVTDPATLGFAVQAMVAVSVTGDVRKVADEVGKLDDVEYVVITAGRFDLLVEATAEQHTDCHHGDAREDDHRRQHVDLRGELRSGRAEDAQGERLHRT